MATAPLRPRHPAGADRSVLWSLAGHGVLLLIVVIGGISLSRTSPPSQLAIKATVVDAPASRQAKPVRKPDRKPLAPSSPEPQRAPAPKARPVPESKPEPKPEPKAEPSPTPQPDPAIAQRKAEQQKQALREKQQAEKAAEKERQAKAEAAKQQAAREKAEAERRQAEAESAELERERNRELEEEERLLAATESGALADYVAVIRQKVERNWVRPASAKAGLECDVRVTQIPGGEVTAVQMDRCNADEAVRRSIEAAVMKASPLPLPDDATLFERNLRFTFKPEQ